MARLVTPAGHDRAWRDPAAVAVFSQEAARLDPRALSHRATAGWWPLLDSLGITLLVTREYEHFVMALGSPRAPRSAPAISWFPLPHPSGLAVDQASRDLYIASTRNPNQVFRFSPLRRLMPRTDVRLPAIRTKPLMPTATWHYPGALYLHDLAWLDGHLVANASGLNAIVRLDDGGAATPIWWPRCIEARGRPVFERNHIQLNSIAAGPTLAESYFSASSAAIGRLRPSHRRYRVKQQGVVFSGATREPICRGLTRPHSVRVRRRAGRDEIWVANSGYGEVGVVEDGALRVVRRLPGWTRGLCLVGSVAFVGTSRLIPRFAHYAPGLDAASCVCGIHAISCRTGEPLASLTWPSGDQVFSIDWMRRAETEGFPFQARPSRERERRLFYAYQASRHER